MNNLIILSLVVSLLAQPPVPTFPPVPSPTPIASLTPMAIQATVAVPHSDIYNFLATVESGLGSAPENITNPGLPVLPGTQGAELFGYAKWILSASTAYEVFGFLGVVVVHLAARLTLMLFLAALGLLILLVTFVLKFIIWIVFKIRAIFP
jgi:hypothetical protein